MHPNVESLVTSWFLCRGHSAQSFLPPSLSLKQISVHYNGITPLLMPILKDWFGFLYTFVPNFHLILSESDTQQNFPRICLSQSKSTTTVLRKFLLPHFSWTDCSWSVNQLVSPLFLVHQCSRMFNQMNQMKQMNPMKQMNQKRILDCSRLFYSFVNQL